MKRAFSMVLIGVCSIVSLSCGFIQQRVSQAFEPADYKMPVTGENAFPDGFYGQTAGEESQPVVGIYFHHGDLNVFSDVAGRESGSYMVAGAQLLINTASCSASGYGYGTYDWEFDGRVLSLFASEEDICAARSDRLEGTYTLAPLP